MTDRIVNRPVPVIHQGAAEQMTANVLKRIDDQVDELLATAGHVALYNFDIPTKCWSRKDVEGSLFLVKRRCQPRFQLMILNKKSAVGTDNFVEEVHGGFQCEVQKPYVLYRNRINEVVGIWFYDDADCDRISALLHRIVSTFSAPCKAVAGVAAVREPPEVAFCSSTSRSRLELGANDDGFWDCRVDTSVGASQHAVSFLQQGVEPAHPHNHKTTATSAAPGIQAMDRLDPAIQQTAGAVPVSESGNDLARLFAGMRMANPTRELEATFTHDQEATAAQVVAAEAAARPTAQPATAPQVLLTPQLIEQEAPHWMGGGTVDLNPGSTSLESLLLCSQQQHVVDLPKSKLQSQVDLAGADVALRSKLAVLLVGLASNETFCGALAVELKKAGIV